VTIGVYRLYLGLSWGRDGLRERLVRGFDLMTAFLYRIDCLDPGAAASPSGPDLQAAVRIAMTQSHVALLRGQPGHSDPALATEIALAQSGFRRRIPILAVTADGALPDDHPLRRAADRVMAPVPQDVASAVQELAEAANAGWRARTREKLAQRAPAALAADRSLAGGGAEAPRALPVDEIARAYARVREGRRPTGRRGDAV
jgi:hypothetical protein